MRAEPLLRRRSGNSRRYGLAAIVGWGILASALVTLGTLTGAAVVVVVLFALFAPGITLVLLLRLEDALVAAAVVILCAISSGVLVPSILLYAHVWSPEGAFAIDAAATLVGAGAGLHARARRAGSR